MVLLLVSCVVGVGLVRLVTCGCCVWLAATGVGGIRCILLGLLVVLWWRVLFSLVLLMAYLCGFGMVGVASCFNCCLYFAAWFVYFPG